MNAQQSFTILFGHLGLEGQSGHFLECVHQPEKKQHLNERLENLRFQDLEVWFSRQLTQN